MYKIDIILWNWNYVDQPLIVQLRFKNKYSTEKLITSQLLEIFLNFFWLIVKTITLYPKNKRELPIQFVSTKNRVEIVS